MGKEGHIRVVIADGHQLFRTGLRLILSAEDGIEVVGETVNGVEMMNVISNLEPDVLLLDTNLARTDIAETFTSIKRKSPETKPLVLTSAEDESLVFKALKAGAKGYVSKDARSCDLIKAIRAVRRGELWVERGLIAQFVERETLPHGSTKERPGGKEKALTGREQEVLRLLTSGGTNKDIAQALFISEKTVKCHLNHIFRKLHVTRRLHAILYAVNRELR